MGALSYYLQQEFVRRSVPGWICHSERQLLPRDLEVVLGYSSRVDILMERQDGSKRLWIEFEISRADPVANHAKFATSHLFQPQPNTDIFISMISPHVARGRRNLGANTISLMRHIGMRAFQTVLFPKMSPADIKRLNHLDLADLAGENLAVEHEIERALSISEVILTASARRIHFASDLMDVMLNVRRWNENIQTSEGLGLWGRRTITYFVFDPYLKKFAPSKFCAYIAIPTKIPHIAGTSPEAIRSEMTIDIYVTIDGTDSRFDGRQARIHLAQRLAMISQIPRENPKVTTIFNEWLNQHSASINVHSNGPVFLLPPSWFK